MSLEKKIEEGRTILGKTIDFVAPFRYKAFGEHFESARKYDPIKELFGQYSHSPEATQYLEQRLAYHLKAARKENRLLKFAGGTTDSIDKILALPAVIPGLGYLAKLPKAAIEWPLKIANSLFYRGKTGDKQFLKDMGFELGTDLLDLLPVGLGSIVDMTNRYSKRVDRYVAQTAAARLVDEIRKQGVNLGKPVSEEELRARRRGSVKIDQEFLGNPAFQGAPA